MAAANAQESPAVVTTSNRADVDPFNVTPRSRSSSHRYSAFDPEMFFSSSQASPSQAKKTLEAHIADTDRRIREASKLGTSLLEQKKELSERLKEVEQRQESTEIDPQLRQKLVELEKEYNDLGRESARAFIPKSRKANAGADEIGTLSTLSGDAHHSPSKLSVPANVPSRKSRNSSNRVEDLAFATEISTSLLTQLRHLQNVLAEKEEQLRDANSKNTKLMTEAEATTFKLRSLDENEQRYKDENWHLETQVQELMMQAKDATLREQKLTNNLNTIKAEKSTAESEFDELKGSHNKLSEEHAALRKKHDAEVATMRRNITATDQEKESLRKKIAELSSQNEDLAKAVAYRIKTERESSEQGRSLEEEEMDLDNLSTDHSPPPSPTKGTPRHGGLESETLKSSLHHAHRMIQNLKNNIHREKTEKLELRRMLQDARDEVELKRADGSATAANAGRRRKPNSQQDLFKKPSGRGKLGEAKTTSEEIMDDPSWEEYDDSPTKARGVENRCSTDFFTNKSDGFETANERGGNATETDGFETANEQDSNATETDAFETAESVAADDTDGDLTETEATQSPIRKSSTLKDMSAGVRSSYQSTASDDGDLTELRTTPFSQPPRYKLRLNRGGMRGISETPSAKGSPASFVSSSSIPAGSQNLAAELEDVGDDNSVADSTPSRSIASQVSSPDLQYKRDTVIQRSIELDTAKPQMVDSGTMTDTFAPEIVQSVAPISALSTAGFTGTATDVILSPSAKGEEISGPNETPAEEPVLISNETVKMVGSASDPIQFELSPIKMQHTEPIAPELPELKARDVLLDTSPTAHLPPSMAFVEQISQGKSVEESDIALSTPLKFAEKVSARDHTQQNAVASQNIFQSEQGPQFSLSENFENPKPQARNSTDYSKRVPFQPVSGNAPMPVAGSPLPMKNEGTQTTVSSDQIDNLIKEKNTKSIGSSSPSPVRPNSSGRALSMGSRSLEQLGLLDFPSPKSSKRPGSAGSLRKTTTSPPSFNAPPLPPDHKEVIAAASKTPAMVTNMPPPAAPAPTFKTSSQQHLPHISSGSFAHPTPSRYSSMTRNRPTSVAGRSDVTRRSSVSSFASEVEERFDMSRGASVYQDQGFDTGADTRMIQAITQTMIGEFMYKYTRKAGRGEHSENRHRRFFWIHPYTRTLYWSTHDPSRANRSELKAKSVPIEAVRVITDENTNPPGLHPKSIVIITPGRSIKITAPTSQRHETWFNALSYLLLRDSPSDRQNEINQQAGVYNNSNNYTNTSSSVHGRSNTISSLTSEDLSEFNPVSRNRSATRMTAGSRNYSYRSHTTSISRTPSILNRSSGALAASLTNRTASSSVPSLTVRQSQGAWKKSGALNATSPVASAATISSMRDKSQHNSADPTQAQVQETPTSIRSAVDAQGFKKPVRPMSLSTNTSMQSPGQTSKAERLRSLSGRLSRQSFFGRNRSSVQFSHGPLESAETTPMTTPSKVAVSRSKSLVGGRDSQILTDHSEHEQVHSEEGDGTITAMENVRACCDGKHDVSSLPHTHQRGTSRARSHASLSSRTSGTFG